MQTTIGNNQYFFFLLFLWMRWQPAGSANFAYVKYLKTLILKSSRLRCDKINIIKCGWHETGPSTEKAKNVPTLIYIFLADQYSHFPHIQSMDHVMWYTHCQVCLSSSSVIYLSKCQITKINTPEIISSCDRKYLIY